MDKSGFGGLDITHTSFCFSSSIISAGTKLLKSRITAALSFTLIFFTIFMVSSIFVAESSSISVFSSDFDFVFGSLCAIIDSFVWCTSEFVWPSDPSQRISFVEFGQFNRLCSTVYLIVICIFSWIIYAINSLCNLIVIAYEGNRYIRFHKNLLVMYNMFWLFVVLHDPSIR